MAAQELVNKGWTVCGTYLEGVCPADKKNAELHTDVRLAIEALPPGTVVLSSGMPVNVANTRQYVCHHSATKGMGAISIPHWFEDRASPSSFESRRYFASFQGAVVSNKRLRQAIVDGFRGCPQAHCEVSENDVHVLPAEERSKLAGKYWKNLSETRFSICPRGVHASSARLYESLAAGCIPVLFADEAQLPLENVLSWDDMIVKVSECRAGEWQLDVQKWMSKRTAADLAAVSRHNRLIFEEWLHWRRLSRQLLVERVERAIERAKRRTSSLSHAVLELPGMSSGKVRHFLNNLQPRRYLEVGVWRGSTFISACFGNALESATAIDNFSSFQDDDRGEVQFVEHVRQHLPGQPFELKNQSFFDIPASDLPRDIDVYFYDGDHSREAQRRAIVHAWPALGCESIVVVDDSNMPGVMEGTRQGLREVQAQVLHEWHLPAHYNGDTEQWWNGLYVAAVRKTA